MILAGPTMRHALGAEAASQKRAQVQRRCDGPFNGRLDLRGSYSDALHLRTDAAVDESRELVERVVRTSARRIRVERIRDAEIILRARHGDVHETALLVRFFVVCECAGRREPAINSPDEKYGFPLFTLGGMGGAQ